MIICKKCGHRNTDADQWCTNPDCGAYLEFEGTSQPTGGMPKVDGDAPPPGRAPDDTPPQGFPPYGGPADTGGTAPKPPTADRLRGSPGRPAEPEIPPIRPGELVCRSCRWGNDPARAFCRHCGAPLSGAAPSPPATGTPRPASPGGMRSTGISAGLLALLVGLALLLGAGAGFGAYALLSGRGGDDGAAGGETESPTPDAGTPLRASDLTVTASSNEYNAGPQFLTDDKEDTYWAASHGWDKPDANPSLTFEFKPSAGVRVTRLEIASGGNGDQFERRPRPAVICLYLDGGDCIERSLLDQGEVQEVRIDAEEPIQELEIKVMSVYPSQARNDSDQNVTIREITLFEER